MSSAVSAGEGLNEFSSWFKGTLWSLFRRYSVDLHETGNRPVGPVLEKLTGTYDRETTSVGARMTLVALLSRGHDKQTAVAHLVKSPVTRSSLSRFVGYCTLLHPCYACLISRSGIELSLRQLLLVYDRTDLLEYLPGRTVKLGQWDSLRHRIVYDSLIPPGAV